MFYINDNPKGRAKIFSDNTGICVSQSNFQKPDYIYESMKKGKKVFKYEA